MKYGKLENEILMPAPKPITKDGLVHYHPSNKLYEELGYLPIVETPNPEVDSENPKYYDFRWEEQEGKIVKVWFEIEPPVPEPIMPSTEERLTTLEEQLKAAKIILGVE